MMRCHACDADVRGRWTRCPLCRTPLDGTPDAAPPPHPDVPLRFDRRQVTRVLLAASAVLILASFGAQLLFRSDIGGLRLVWFGLISLWSVVVIVVRKRRNVAKGIAYLVVFGSLICAYWDYLSGWTGWSITYAIPIICGSSILALLIVVRIVRLQPRDYLVYAWLTILFALVPAVFLALGWVSDPLASWVSVALGILMLVGMQLFRGGDVEHELRKRLHL